LNSTGISKDITEFIKAIQSFAGINSYEVFSDFVELAALSTMQAFELNRQKELTEQINSIQKKYKPKEIERLGNMFGLLIMTMEKYHKQGRYVDILARVFMELEIHSKQTGQFFTPGSVAELSAKMAFDEAETKKIIERDGHITLNEPAVCGGVMVLGFAEAMREAGFDPSRQLLIHAGDIDRRCACMSYLHFSLYGLPAVVKLGDALAMKAWEQWYTPVYVLDLWCFRDRRNNIAV
jgi:type I restriction-modification system DNA methylase subunit